MKRSEPPNRRTSEDRELVVRLRDGDETAFARLIDTWSGGMHRLALSYVGSSASADEVVQETWGAVLENLAAFAGSSSPKHWIHRILVSTAKRRVREHRVGPVGDPVEEGGTGLEPSRFRGREELFPGHWRDLPAPWPPREEAPEAAEVRAVLENALRRLPPRQAAAVTLRDVEGYEADEAAALLGVSLADQRALLRRGRAVVRTALEEYLLSGETDRALGDSGQT